MFVIVFQKETDGEIELRHAANEEAIKTFLKLGEGRELGPEDYAIIKGSIIKSFDNKHLWI